MYWVYACAMIVQIWADHLLLQLLMEQFDNLYSQCRHIEHMREGVLFKKIFFAKQKTWEFRQFFLNMACQYS